MAYFLTRDNPNQRAGLSSDFYMACKHNDLDRVRAMIRNRSNAQLNQIESNGGTALHAAVYYGYPELVELLLQHGCDPDIEDSHSNKPRDYSRHQHINILLDRYTPSTNKDSTNFEHIDQEHVRELFNELNRYANDKDDVPLEGMVTVYRKPNDSEEQSFLERILRVRWKIYHINRYKIPAEDNCSYIRSIFKKNERYKNNDCKLQFEKVDELLSSYERTKDPQYLLKFYRVTNSLQILHHDSIQMEIYLHLQKISKENFEGRTYQARILTVTDLLPFQWAFHNPGCILELRQFTTTLCKRPLAEKHIEKPPKDLHRLRVLFIFDILKECCTAIDTNEAPNEDTRGIRLLSGTFLNVINIQQNIEKGYLEIYLKTVPLPLDAITQATRELDS